MRGQDNALLESFVGIEGKTDWQEVWTEESEAVSRRGSMADYVERRRSRDADLWIIELDVASRAQFDAIIAAMS